MDYVNAFWVGGLICALVQILLEKTKLLPGRIMVLDAVLDEMVEAAYQDACTKTNPRACSKEDIRGVFLRAYTGRLI